jgi:hypothetical protein
MKGFLFEKEKIHRLNNIAGEVKYPIQLGNSTYHLTKVQLLFLSLRAFRHFENSIETFQIVLPSDTCVFSNFSQQILEKCFSNLVSLFDNENEIKIDHQNLPYFKYLSEILDNRSLLKQCSEVTESHSQSFCLSSKNLFTVSQEDLSSLHDFALIINKKKIELNFSLICCISDKLLEMNKQQNQLEIILPEETLPIFHSFMRIFE